MFIFNQNNLLPFACFNRGKNKNEVKDVTL